MENTKELVSTGAHGWCGRRSPASLRKPQPLMGERRGLSRGGGGRSWAIPGGRVWGRRPRSVWVKVGDSPGCCGGGPTGCGGLCPPGSGAPGAGPALLRAGESGRGTWGRQGCTPLLRPSYAGSSFVLRLSFLLSRRKVSASRGHARIRFSPYSAVMPAFSNFLLYFQPFKVEFSSVVMFSAGEFSLLSALQKFWLFCSHFLAIPCNFYDFWCCDCSFCEK